MFSILIGTLILKMQIKCNTEKRYWHFIADK